MEVGGDWLGSPGRVKNRLGKKLQEKTDGNCLKPGSESSEQRHRASPGTSEEAPKGPLTSAWVRVGDHRGWPAGRGRGICWVPEARVEGAGPFILVPL